jgi:small-conductance mechanosensitive channel
MLRRDYPPVGAYGWPPPPLAEVRARWARWASLAVAALGALALVAFVLSHDDPRQPGLADRAWLTLGLAAVLLVLLAVHYYAGGARRLLRALVEYAVVALLAVLLTLSALPAATRPATNQPAANRAPAQHSAANPARPPSRPPAKGSPLGHLAVCAACSAAGRGHSSGDRRRSADHWFLPSRK